MGLERRNGIVCGRRDGTPWLLLWSRLFDGWAVRWMGSWGVGLGRCCELMGVIFMVLERREEW